MTCCPSVGMTRNSEEMEKNNSLKDRHHPPLNPSGGELLTAETSKKQRCQSYDKSFWSRIGFTRYGLEEMTMSVV